MANLVFEKKRKDLQSSSIHDQLENIYWRGGAIVEETGEKTLTLKDFEEKYLKELHEFAEKVQPNNIWKKYSSLDAHKKEDPEKQREHRLFLSRNDFRCFFARCLFCFVFLFKFFFGAIDTG